MCSTEEINKINGDEISAAGAMANFNIEKNPYSIEISKIEFDSFKTVVIMKPSAIGKTECSIEVDRRCIKCDQVKIVKHFCKNRNLCKMCKSEQNRKYRNSI